MKIKGLVCPDVQIRHSDNNFGLVGRDNLSLTVYPALEQSTDSLVVWKLPKWDAAGGLCGSVDGVKACNHHKEDYVFLYHRCFKPECPVCYKAWVNREAERVVERLKSAEKLYNGRLGVIKHFVVSPPQEWAVKLMNDKDGFKVLKAKCIKLLKKSGLFGGCVIFHSHRKDGLVWFYSPHFHIVGYGCLINSDIFYEKSGGWIYKNKGVRKSVFGTVSYLLTHCGLGYNSDGVRVFHCVVWFGCLSYNKIVIESETKVLVPELCSKCKEPLHRFVSCYYGGSDVDTYKDFDSWEDMGIYVHIKRVRRYRLRGGYG